ncbi:helix-turn-helix domain-containing protein [Mangrovitalea sediminis]|uniref:helix-turn-helix domain-containing protein n=1 Tax=Mangrovitalea sediminis TaxID=1982043 RepID=UPI000BE4C5E1|nr:AraC family transcriptional regulator [Mangrovitalea sediminis]
MSHTIDQFRFPSQYLDVFAAFLRDRGKRLESYAQRCGLTRDLRPASGTGISGSQLQALMALSREVADPRIPLAAQLLEHLPVTAHGTLGIVILTSPNLQAALEAALRFYPVVMPAYDIACETHGDKMHMLFQPRCDPGDMAEDLTEVLLGAFNSIRRYVRPTTRLLEIHLRHQARFPAEAYASFADPDGLFFGCPRDKIVIPKRHLSFSLTTSNRITMEQFRQQLEWQIAGLDHPESFTAQVRERLRRALHDNRYLGVEDMAAGLNMSSRTLGRRLQREGRSFKQLTHEVRIDYAEFLLLNSPRTVSQIAYAAGFTNNSSFARAFRKRKGFSPSELRQQSRPRPKRSID